jgi:peroxiredoxin
MNLPRRLPAWAALAFGITVIVVFALPSYRQGEASVAGKTADDFSLDISGKPGHLSDLRGKVIVLNFWATWCLSCIEETPALDRLERHIASRGGMVLGVSVDEDADAYYRFLQDHGITFSTYRDPSRKIASDYGTSFFPETYVIDRRGRIAREFIGPQSWDSPEMLAYFDAVLGKS